MFITLLLDVVSQIQQSFRPFLTEPVSASCDPIRVSRWESTKALFSVVTIGAVLVGSHAAHPAWSADLPFAVPVKPGKTVAAGFGYQDAETSSITVKTYDADSGEVLSAESYDLDIKDDGPSSSQPRARIFAGGVGVGADGLSEFMLRVYDAANGRFLWEGRLNLSVSNNPDVEAYPVMAQVRPRAAVTKVSGRTKITGQPYFVLRAVNPETGQVIWTDEFSVDTLNVRVERISRGIIGMTGGVPSEIDFRIKMPDEAGRQLLWEDKVVPTVDEDADVQEWSDETGAMLPLWPHGQGDHEHSNNIM